MNAMSTPHMCESAATALSCTGAAGPKCFPQGTLLTSASGPMFPVETIEAGHVEQMWVGAIPACRTATTLAIAASVEQMRSASEFQLSSGGYIVVHRCTNVSPGTNVIHIFKVLWCSSGRVLVGAFCVCVLSASLIKACMVIMTR